LEFRRVLFRSAFRQNRGVMARGFWLTRDKLDAALTTLAEVQSEADLDTQISGTAVRVAAEKAESLTQQGFVFDARMLMALARTLRAEGFGDRKSTRLNSS